MTGEFEETGAIKDARTAILETVNVRVDVYVGHADMTVADIMQAKPGTVIALEAPLTQTVELRLNGKAVAVGELVAVGDCFGVRVTEIAQA
jgi:flagellar motor switch protein FliN